MNKLTIYFTADTHGYLYPTHFRDLETHPMGLLSMDFPKDENTLIIDGGDTIQGSPLTTYCRFHNVPAPVAEVMNAKGYDYVTLGNHDFNQGQEVLGNYLKSLNAKCLCANVADASGRLPIASTAIHTLGNGTRVGLVGLVTHWVNRWERPENLEGLTVSDPMEAARKAVKELRDNVDVLVGIYHGGVEKNLTTGEPLSDTDENIACRLCEELPFDLLLTGHLHTALAGAQWHGTWLVQPPCNATEYIRVTMDEEGKFTSELCPVSGKAELTTAQERLWRDLNRWLDTPIGHLSAPLKPRDHLTMALEGNGIADFYNRVQLWASGADISCAALANEVRGFETDVTVRDVVASYVYSNTLVTLRITGAKLKAALEQCATFFAVTPEGRVEISPRFELPKPAYFNYDYFAGIAYTIDLNQPVGSRITELTVQEHPVADTEEFALCLCDYRATGAGDFEMYRTCPRIRENQTEISELILDYLRENPYVEIPESHACRVILPEKARED